MHTHCVGENTDNRSDLTQYLIPIHSFTRRQTPARKLADCLQGIVPFIVRWGGYGFQIENSTLIQMKHMLPLSELIGKARSFQSG